MSRLLINCFLCIATLVATPVFAQGDSGTLLVANRIGGSVSMIDLQSKTEIARLPIGPVIPHEMAASSDGRWAVTSEYGTGNNPGRHLIVIDVAAASIVSRIDLGPNTRPHSIVFLQNNRHVVVTLERASEIALVDIIDGTIVRTFATGGQDSHMVRLAPDDSRAYVASRGSGTLSVIWLNEDRPPEVIQTGARAEGISVSPDGQQIWVANQGDSTVTIVDAVTLQARTALTGIATNRVEFLPDGQAVLPGGFNSGREITLLDADTLEVTQVLELPASNSAGTGVRLLAADNALFLADSAINEIAVFDPSSGNAPERLGFYPDNVDGMAWSPLRMSILGD